MDLDISSESDLGCITGMWSGYALATYGRGNPFSCLFYTWSDEKSMLETQQNLLAIKMTSEFFLRDSYNLLLDTYSVRPNLVILGVVVNADTTVL